MTALIATIYCAILSICSFGRLEPLTINSFGEYEIKVTAKKSGIAKITVKTKAKKKLAYASYYAIKGKKIYVNADRLKGDKVKTSKRVMKLNGKSKKKTKYKVKNVYKDKYEKDYQPQYIELEQPLLFL